jgi:ribosomal protein S18 acetylase RimI-like enzyme
MRVRDAVPDDAAAIARVHVRGWQAAYRGQMPDAYLDGLDVAQRERAWAERLGAAERDRPGRTLVAEDGGRVVGFAGVGPAEDDDAGPTTGEVYAIYVSPERLRQGIGATLLARAEDALREAGYDEATLWVLAANAGAIAFYERAGWRADGSRTDQLIGGLSLPSVRYRTRLA